LDSFQIKNNFISSPPENPFSLGAGMNGGKITHTLKDREWKCVCGKNIDRDYNASLNILKQGLNMSGLGTKSLNKQKQVESLSLDKAMKLEAHSL
jgi:hypothetical protein